MAQHSVEQIRRWNAVVPRPVNALLHDVIKSQAKQRPLAPAVCSWDGELVYGELQSLTSRLASYLFGIGLRPGMLVPSSFEKSIYAVIATLAIIKTGAAFVPLDFSHPRRRLTSILRRIEAKTILTSAETAPAFEGLVPSSVLVDQALLNSLVAEDSIHNGLVKPDDPVFVLFTSGSSGEPKGVVQTHASVCTINEAYRKSLFINENSRVLQFAAYTFDVSTVDVFTTLSVGGCICIPKDHDRLNDLTRVINEFQANWIDVTPSFALASIPHPEDVPSLNTLVLAGEEVKREHVAHFVDRIPHVINCYGPAEAGGCVTNLYQSRTSQPQTIGRAIGSVRCWIVDENDRTRLLPIGATGELVVEGPTLALGYLKDKEKTSLAFFECLGYDGQKVTRRYYATGDLVRYRPDGKIDFIGRKDTQVKIRGQRVELSEVEQWIAAHSKVHRCIVAFPKAGIYAHRLVGVLEPHVDPQSLQRLHHLDSELSLLSDKAFRQNAISVRSLTKELAKSVPAYMVPNVWLAVRSMPLTDSKKVDRRRVLNWLIGLSHFDRGLNQNSTPSAPLIPDDDHTAQEIGFELSRIVSSTSSEMSFALKGHDFVLEAAGIDSVRAVTLSKRLLDKYEVKLPVDVLLQSNITVTDLARIVLEERAKSQLASPALEKQSVLDEVVALSKTLDRSGHSFAESSTPLKPSEVVLLTGATGFLGIEILRQLLEISNIQRICILLRAASLDSARERLATMARRAGWLLHLSDSRIDIWLGDLTQMRLGLNDVQWSMLTRYNTSKSSIDTIIHNGAWVRWDLGYDTLKAANVLSTVQLLEALKERKASGRFVYVSGGQKLAPGDADNEADIALSTSHLTGYSKTKIVSELVVKRFAEQCDKVSHLVRIVKPSYIIASPQRCRANPEDYLWRLVKTAIDLGAYNEGEANSWLFVSDATTVAGTVCEICSSDATLPVVRKILDGVIMNDLWGILSRDFGYELRPLQPSGWWKQLRSTVDAAGPKHPLWALQHILEADKGELASGSIFPTPKMVFTRPSVLQALRGNIVSLRDDLSFLSRSALGRSKL